MTVIPKLAPPTIFCARCGNPYMRPLRIRKCGHYGTACVNITPDHAARINARWTLSRQANNPNHDTTRFTDPGFLAVYAGQTDLVKAYPEGYKSNLGRRETAVPYVY